ncbi:unnamed protein product [Brachionus calyciflorus]|uniref:Autophagy-related protein n=1 Tax=Brachionus calyciflorus TaxID=104777 RepID=A0A813WJU7_9BILA|nr:unnamed protein product [Brachionus calyciflorus]
MRWKYKEEKSFEERYEEATRVKHKYANRIPIIVEKRPESKLPELSVNKYLVERDSSVAQFLYSVRKRLPPMASQETIFFFVGRNMTILSARIGDLYDKYKDRDEFIYMSYSEENVFDMALKWAYKESKSYEDRLEESRSIIKIYPDSVPVIVQKYHKSSLPELTRKKYIVPRQRQLSSFYFTLRKHLKIDKSQSFFLMINNMTTSLSSTIGDIYDNHKDNDGFLYVMYFDENSFGYFV